MPVRDLQDSAEFMSANDLRDGLCADNLQMEELDIVMCPPPVNRSAVRETGIND